MPTSWVLSHHGKKRGVDKRCLLSYVARPAKGERGRAAKFLLFSFFFFLVGDGEFFFSSGFRFCQQFGTHHAGDLKGTLTH